MAADAIKRIKKSRGACSALLHFGQANGCGQCGEGIVILIPFL